MIEVVDGRVQLLVSMTEWSRGRDTLLSYPEMDGSRDVGSLDDSHGHGLDHQLRIYFQLGLIHSTQNTRASLIYEFPDDG